MSFEKKVFIISGAELCSSKISGITRYMYEVITRLDILLNEYNDKLTIKICYPKEQIISLPSLKNIELVQLEKGNKKWHSQILRKYVKNQNAVFIGMSNNFALNSNSIICLHDIRPIATFGYDPLLRKLEYLVIGLTVKLFAKYIVTVSETQKDLIKRKLRVKANRIIVIPNGWEHIEKFDYDDTIFNKFTKIRKSEYFYSLGSIALHKNYKWILEVAKNNPQETFVIAGGESMRQWTEDYKNYNLNNLVFVGYVTDEENKSLLKHCKAFIHPSKFEGFGIPPMEALTQKKEVIVSKISCLPEIYGKSAHYINPDIYDVNLSKLITEKVEPAEKVLEKYSWEISARRWLNLLLEY